MVILALVIPLVLSSLFYIPNQDFWATSSRQMEEGYRWHYIGYAKAKMEVPSLPLQVDDRDPYVLWQLQKSP